MANMMERLQKAKIDVEIQKVTRDELWKNGTYYDKDTFLTTFAISSRLKSLINEDPDYWKDDAAASGVCDTMVCEYQLDMNKFVYLLYFEHDVINVTDLISCDSLNQKILNALD